MPHGVTPHLVVFKVKPDVFMVHVFGCMVKNLIPEHEREGKLASKTRWGMHLGMSMESKGWRVVDSYLAEDDCDTDSDDEVEYPNEDEKEEGAWGGVILDLAAALTGPEGKEWWAAMKEEIESLDEQGTWTLADLPKGRKTVGIKWLLKKKLRLDGTVEKYKARLVAKGFSQRFGIDYDNTYAPVGSYTTVRVLLSIAAAMDLYLLQLDVKNAFLHGTIDHEIYMQQPPYFTDASSKVCLLQKSLYGLKPSPLLWYKDLDKVLLVEGYKKSLVDQALYYKDMASGKCVWLLIYVDDLLAASEDKKLLQDLKELLAKVFHLREEEPVECHLGLQIVRDHPYRTLLLHQNAYVAKVQQWFFKGAPPKKQSITPLSSASFAKQDAEQFANRTMTEYLSILSMVQFAAIAQPILTSLLRAAALQQVHTSGRMRIGMSSSAHSPTGLPHRTRGCCSREYQRVRPPWGSRMHMMRPTRRTGHPKEATSSSLAELPSPSRPRSCRVRPNFPPPRASLWLRWKQKRRGAS
ncbi:unnamed protein product [Closterium sp. NIES-54]